MGALFEKDVEMHARQKAGPTHDPKPYRMAVKYGRKCGKILETCCAQKNLDQRGSGKTRNPEARERPEKINGKRADTNEMPALLQELSVFYLCETSCHLIDFVQPVNI